MDWLKRMNEAIAYIEANLEGEIDLAKAGRLAGCGAYHFQRVFAYMANVTAAEYIRRRRLTCAAFALQRKDAKVIDVALQYGYDSPTSFTRAFSALHGITPSQAKKNGVSLVAYPPISFQITIQGVKAMNYRIETKEAFRVVGSCIETTMQDDQAFREIPEFWAKMHMTGMIPTFCSMMDGESKDILGISISKAADCVEFTYQIGVETTQPVPEGMKEYQIPKATWAIFESVGAMPLVMQELQKQIYTEWLPNSGYEYDESVPNIEVYGEGNPQANDYKCWVWMPIVKK